MQVEAWEIANNWCRGSFLVYCQPHSGELPSAIHWQHPAAQPLRTLSPPFLNSPSRPPRHDEFCGFSTSFWRNMDLPLWSLLSTSVSVPFQKKQNTEQAWAKQLDNKNLQLKSTSIFTFPCQTRPCQRILSFGIDAYILCPRRVLSRGPSLKACSPHKQRRRQRNLQSKCDDSKREPNGWLCVQARRKCETVLLSARSPGVEIPSPQKLFFSWKTERWDPTAAPLKV